MKKDFIWKFPDDFNFSEEILVLKDNYNEREDKPSNFDIVFSSKKKCNISSNNPAINDTNICRNCYYTKFAEKLSSVRKSKRRDFLFYQLSKRQNKVSFLNELGDFLTDNEEYFNDIDYTITIDYNNYLVEFLDNIDTKTIDVKPIDSIMENLGNANNKNQSFDSITLDIFISHSSSDKEIAESLIDLLIVSLRIEANKIRCTSVEGFKLEGGVNTDERLKFEILSSNILIGIISKDSLNSHYVLFELGARWGSKKPFRPVVINQSDYKLLRGPLKNINVLNLSNSSDISQLLEEISNILKLKIEPTSKYQKKIQDLIMSVSKKKVNEENVEENDQIILSEDSMRILLELYDDPSGTLLVVNTFDGYAIQTNNKSFVDNKDPKERANLEYALDQLLEFNFISARGNAGTVFGITKEGYSFIDNLK